MAPTVCFDDGILKSENGAEQSVADMVARLAFANGDGVSAEQGHVQLVMDDAAMYRDSFAFNASTQLQLVCTGFFSCAHSTIAFANLPVDNLCRNGSHA